MTCQRNMAVFAGIVGRAALHFDGDDVRVLVVVQAARLRIEIQATDLWSICRRGPVEDRFLFSWRWHSMRAYHFRISLWMACCGALISIALLNRPLAHKSPDLRR